MDAATSRLNEFATDTGQSGGAKDYLDIEELIARGKAPIEKELHEIAIITANTSVAIMSAASGLLKMKETISKEDTAKTISIFYDECVYVVDKSRRIAAAADPIIKRDTNVNIDTKNINIISVQAAIDAATTIVVAAEEFSSFASESFGQNVAPLIKGTEAATNGVSQLVTIAIKSCKKSLESTDSSVRLYGEILLAEAIKIKYRAETAMALATAAIPNGSIASSVPLKKIPEPIVAGTLVGATHIEAAASSESLNSGLDSIQNGINALSEIVNELAADRPTNLFDKSELCPLVDPNEMEAIYIRNTMFVQERLRLVLERIENRNVRKIISENLDNAH
jgi:hypothetical protein